MAIQMFSDSSHRDRVSLSASTMRGRVLAIDVVRGLLICLITVGHSRILLSDSGLHRWLDLLIEKVTNLGTPAFTLVSGMLLGYFECTHADFRRIRRKYFRRGLQLFTFAHLLIAVATYPLRQETSFAEVYLRYWYITDTLALLFVTLPTLVPRLRPLVRISIGIACLLSWKLLLLYPSVSPPVLLLLKEFLFGVNLRGDHLLGDTYPIVPLAGLFLIGTTLGNAFARSLVRGTVDRFVRSLRRGIAPLLLLSGSFFGLWIWGKMNGGNVWGSALKLLFYPEKLASLLPFYFAIFLLILTRFLVRIELLGRFGTMEKVLALIGQNSLFAYVAQYFLVQTIPSLIGWRNHLTAVEMILYLGGTLMILFYLVCLYNNSALKQGKSGRKAKPTAGAEEIQPGGELVSLQITPELLDLKKDLW